jgi:hypothetical protein
LDFVRRERFADNTVERQRKPDSSSTQTARRWLPPCRARGIAASVRSSGTWRKATDDVCSDGALVTSGDGAGLPIEFPRALGNVLRHNSFVASRQNGVILTSRKRDAARDPSASVVGTVVEFNAVRDAPVAYHVAEGADLAVVRRNHAYNWSFVNEAKPPTVALQIDAPDVRVACGQNTVEGRSGTPDVTIIEKKQP